jgi:hypothetical protein
MKSTLVTIISMSLLMSASVAFAQEIDKTDKSHDRSTMTQEERQRTDDAQKATLDPSKRTTIDKIRQDNAKQLDDGKKAEKARVDQVKALSSSDLFKTADKDVLKGLDRLSKNPAKMAKLNEAIIGLKGEKDLSAQLFIQELAMFILSTPDKHIGELDLQTTEQLRGTYRQPGQKTKAEKNQLGILHQARIVMEDSNKPGNADKRPFEAVLEGAKRWLMDRGYSEEDATKKANDIANCVLKTA